MRTIFPLLLIVFNLFIAFSSYAAINWNKGEYNDFRKAKEYNLVFDSKDIQYEGLDSLQFVDYAANLNKTTPEKIGATLRFVEYEIVNNIQTKAAKKFRINSESPAEILVKILNINYKAGITAEVTIIYNGKNLEKSKKIKIEDGRWNVFEKLMQENCEELAKKIVSYITEVRDYGW